MKNTAKKSAQLSPQHTRRVIQLDQSQYALYQSGHIEIHAPDDSLLETVGERIAAAEAEVHRSKLHDQLSLVSALVINTNGHLELTDHAAAGLADLLFEAQQQLG
jgi:hypothetical protein